MKTRHARSPVWNHLLRHALLMCAGVVLTGPTAAAGATFVNTTPINIAVGGQPNPYPSNIAVSNVVGVVADVSVTLNGLSHSFPDDLDILLVGPGGQTVLLMSDAGGGNPLVDPPVQLTFSDSASAVLPDSNRIVTGSYRPSNYEAATFDQFAPPAPGPPYGNSLSVFGGTNPNGFWRLFVADDNTSQGFGRIGGGWELNLTLALPPVTTVVPQEEVASPGDTVIFQAVVVTGTPPFTYQWWHNGQPIGATASSPTLTIPNVQAGDAGFYSVVVANVAAPNGVRSSEAHLNVLGPLTIVQPPPSVIAPPGVDVRLCVAVSGLPPIRYQWTLNGMVLSNQIDSCLNLLNVDAKSGGNYQVVVWNDNEAITTQPALVLVRAATNPNSPTDSFTDRPQLDDFKAVLQGNNAQARTESGEPVLRGGGRTVWLQWVAPDTGIATFGARGSSFDTLLAVYVGTKLENLTLVAKDDDRGGFYTSSVQFNTQRGAVYQIQLDGFGRTGAGGEFTLCWDLEPTEEQIPIIVTEPASQGVHPGGTAIFKVQAEPADAQYQWFFNGRPIPGATSDMFVVQNARSVDVGLYSVRVMNRFQRVLFSESANLQLGSFTFPLAQDKLENVYFAMRSGQSGGGGFPGGGGFIAAAGGSLGAGYIGIGIGNLVSNEVISAANHQAGDPNPCGSPLFGTLWQGLAATNSGVIQVDTFDSEILARMAVYRFATNTGILSSTNIVCDLSSASNGFPAVASFAAEQGSNYVIVLEGYQAIGNLQLNCKMGLAPALTNPVRYCFVPEGGSITLSMPATNWCPLPSCQWRFKGVDIPGATGHTLPLTAFDAGDVGMYSVRMSNFVRTATRDVAYVGLSGPFLLNHWWVTNSGNVGFAINASNSIPFVLETTTNLSGSWLPIATNPDPCLVLIFTNSGALNDPQRFFRAAPWTPPGP